MNVALMVITDGRWDYLQETLDSIAKCEFPFTDFIIVNDSGERVPDEVSEVQVTAGGVQVARWVGGERRGLAGAIQTGWDALRDGCDYVFHLEDDFTFPQPIPIAEMLSALQAYPDLAQVALKRQPWSPQEQLAGNMLLLKPGLTQMDNLCCHRHLFTFNPCLYPREITRYGAALEQELTDKLIPDGWQFAYYGGKHDDPRCIHIGHRRSEGYRW